MGIVLSCIGLANNLNKKKKSKKEGDAESQRQSQPLSAQSLQSEQLASTRLPPPSSQVEGLERTEVAAQEQETSRARGTSETVQGFGTEASVPISTIANPSLPTNSRAAESKGDKMATDEDYMAFLDKANQDLDEGLKSKGTAKGKVELKATDKGVTVPAALKKATEDAFYVSDADEPFVPVCLKWEKKSLPDEASFAKLVNHPSPKEAEVQILDIAEWDTQGQYKELVDATREAVKGSDVRVYRISHGGSRVEYWLVGLDSGKLMGAKALAIES